MRIAIFAFVIWSKSKRTIYINCTTFLFLTYSCLILVVRKMNLDEYQEKARKTDLHTKVKANELDYYLLGLATETGDVLSRVKYVYRDYKGNFSAIEKEKIKKELGDLLWYLSAICDRFDFSLEDVAELNLKKLSNRAQNNTLHGENPDR